MICGFTLPTSLLIYHIAITVTRSVTAPIISPIILLVEALGAMKYVSRC
jgi:hypothetical protein